MSNERAEADSEEKEELEEYKRNIPYSSKLVKLKHEKAILLRKTKSLEIQVRTAKERIQQLNDYNANLCETLKSHDEIEKQRYNKVFRHEKQIQELEDKINILQQEKVNLEDDLMRERERQSIMRKPPGRMDHQTVVRPELKKNFESQGLRDKNASTSNVSLQCDIPLGHLETSKRASTVVVVVPEDHPASPIQDKRKINSDGFFEGVREENASKRDVSLNCDILRGHLENNVYLHEKHIQEIE